MIRFVSARFAYRAGDRGYSVTSAVSAENKRVSLDIEEKDDVLSIGVRTRTPVTIMKLCAEFEYDFSEDQKIFLNGYQSWTDSTEHGINDKLRGIDGIPAPLLEKYAFSQYGDYNFVRYGKKAGLMHGFSYGYIRSADGVFDLIGSLNEDDGFTVIRTDTKRGRIYAQKDCSGLTVNDGYAGLCVCALRGTENEVFDRYFELMKIKPLPAKPVFGYTSWYRHYQDISAAKIADDLDGMKDCGIKPDVFQIDDGYQTAVGDWLSIDAGKFPEGTMKPCADAAKEAGMIPGLWLAPFVCEERSVIFREKKSWLLTDENGSPVRGGSNWSGFYALDIYNEEVREYIKHVFDVAVNDWGFGLLKLDFLYAACLLPRRDKTRGRVMADAMEFIREAAGKAMILGCGVPLASAFGRVEYCRVGMDVTPDWNDKLYMQLMHRERPSTRNTILNSVFRRQLSGRAFINDPDVFMLRTGDTSMSQEQKLCLGTVNALCGGVLFTSDNFSGYTDMQKQQLADILALRDAKLLCADHSGRELVIAAEKDGAYSIRKFTV